MYLTKISNGDLRDDQLLVRAVALTSQSYTPLTCLMTAKGGNIIEALGMLWQELQEIDSPAMKSTCTVGESMDWC